MALAGPTSVVDIFRIIGPIATSLAVIVALFKDIIWGWWDRPVLELEANTEEPHCQRSSFQFKDRSTESCYYLRLWVKNCGKSRAEKVQVYVDSLHQKNGDKFEPVKNYLPMNLTWSHTGLPAAEGIHAGMAAHCDLGYILRPPISHSPRYTSLELCLEVFSYPVVASLSAPGEYKMTILLAAANRHAKLKRYELDLELDGEWYDNLKEMFAKGITIKATEIRSHWWS